MKATRREVVGWLGVAALVPPSVAAARPAAAALPEQRGSERPVSAADLLAPLTVGAQLGEWTVVGMGVLHAGAVGVDLATARGDVFHIDICARDGGLGAPTPPAATDRCELFVANEGKGQDPTRESHGLAAMALAEIVRTQEHRVDLRGLRTLRERLAHHGEEVVRTCVQG